MNDQERAPEPTSNGSEFPTEDLTDEEPSVIGGPELTSVGEYRLTLIYDVEEHQTVQEFRGHTQKVLGVCASRHGERLYSAGDNVRGWTIETAGQFFEFNEHDDEVFAVDESPDGTTLASGGTDGTIRIITLPDPP